MTLSSYIAPVAIAGILIAGTRLAGCCNKECSLCTDVAIVVFVGGIFLLKKYMQGGHYSGTETIKGKTVVITGANTGIGFETAKELARRGGRIIIACRDKERGEAAKNAIIADTGNSNVYLKKLDLASFASIRAFCKEINASENRIDILINNAGIMICPKMLTEDGFEMQIGVNHIGHFLLTNLLLDKLKASAPSRIIIVSSRAHIHGRINFSDLNSASSYNRVAAYGQSKLANILYGRELAKRLNGTGVTVNSLHPGAVNTELTRHVPFIDSTFVGRLLTFPIRYIFFKTAVEGAQTTLRLALDPSLETVTGKYFSDCKIVNPSSKAQDDDAAKKLWDVTEAMIEKKI